ncbi:hypothetical protein C1H84_16250 [Glutamicibacter soli]|uniref:Uncharacterized protein n=1 Tax=Glutamicibacter soli TaxID=453836 RepID=A0A365Y967_9MICC|nr:hypothetical protein C1H84_16250 [Glutamicibacter soli]
MDKPELAIILEGKSALRQRIILWGRGPASTNESDGETLSDGSPDPDAELTFQERKQKARDGVGAEPQIEVFFRIADHEDLGIFKFQTGSWSMAQDLARDNAENELAHYVDASRSGKVKANLKLEAVEFAAKSSPRAGQLVSYTQPVLEIKGAA